MKQIEIELERWRGHVKLHDPLPLVKLADFEDAAIEALKIDPKLGKARAHARLIPALIECVAEWKIEGLEITNAESFPGAGTGISKVDIALLINFLVNKIFKLIEGKDPND